MKVINFRRHFYPIKTIKDGIFYLFNKEKILNKLDSHKESVKACNGIGITNKVMLYGLINLAEDIATFRNYNSLEEYLKAPLGDIKALKNLGASI